MHTRQTRHSSNLPSRAPDSSMSVTAKASGPVRPKRKGNSSTKKPGKSGGKSTSAAGVSDIADLSGGLTPEQLGLYNAMYAELEAQKKATAAAKEEGASILISASYFYLCLLYFLAIRMKNQHLMEQEESGDDDSQQEDEDADAPPSKKSRTDMVILDSDESAFASSIRPIRPTPAAVSQYQHIDIESQDGDGPAQANDEQSDQGDADIDMGDFDNNGEDDPENIGFQDNGVCCQSFQQSHTNLLYTFRCRSLI